MIEEEGSINKRILQKNQGPDALRKLESAYRDYPTAFYSAEVKRLFLRFFDITTLQVHYVEVIVRLKEGLGAEVAEKCEAHLNDQIKKLLDEVDRGIDGAHALMQANGLTKEAAFLQAPITFSVRVTSPIMRNYLRLMEKTDQLIRMMETLRIDGVVSTAQCDSRRGVLKRHIKIFATSARRLANDLRVRARKLETADSNNATPRCKKAKKPRSQRPMVMLRHRRCRIRRRKKLKKRPLARVARAAQEIRKQCRSDEPADCSGHGSCDWHRSRTRPRQAVESRVAERTNGKAELRVDHAAARKRSGHQRHDVAPHLRFLPEGRIHKGRRHRTRTTHSLA